MSYPVDKPYDDAGNRAAFRLVLLAIAALVALGGGWALYDSQIRDPANVRYCEFALLETLKAPATYKRVSAATAGAGRDVTLRFDAANSYGTPLRGSATCAFAGGDGAPAMTGLTVDGRAYRGADLLVFDTLARARFEGRR